MGMEFPMRIACPMPEYMELAERSRRSIDRSQLVRDTSRVDGGSVDLPESGKTRPLAAERMVSRPHTRRRRLLARTMSRRMRPRPRSTGRTAPRTNKHSSTRPKDTATHAAAETDQFGRPQAADDDSQEALARPINLRSPPAWIVKRERCRSSGQRGDNSPLTKSSLDEVGMV